MKDMQMVTSKVYVGFVNYRTGTNRDCLCQANVSWMSIISRPSHLVSIESSKGESVLFVDTGCDFSHVDICLEISL